MTPSDVEYSEARVAVADAKRSRDQGALALALRRLARAERRLGHLGPALDAYREAVDLHLARGEEREAAHALRHVGDVRRQMGEIKDAHADYVEALGLYRSLPLVSSLELANAIRPLALTLEALGDGSGAMDLWHEARSLYVEANVPAAVSEADAHLALR